MKNWLKDNLLLCIIFSIVAIPFCWWITNERLANAEAKQDEMEVLTNTLALNRSLHREQEVVIIEPNETLVFGEDKFPSTNTKFIASEDEYEEPFMKLQRNLHFAEPNEPELAELSIQCPCGLTYKLAAKEIAYGPVSMLTAIDEPSEPQAKEFTPWELLIMEIPTWPDYIELPKDLVIERYTEGRLGHELKMGKKSLMIPLNKQIIPKGTKIYFKEKK